MADSSTFDAYTLAGLDQAKALLGKTTAPYPSYTPSQTLSPSQMSYYNYTPTAPMNQIQAPNYEVTAGDAEAWQKWTPQNAPNYGTVNTQTGVSPWDYQSVSPNATAAEYNWLDTPLDMQTVANPYSAYGGADPTYQKLGVTPTFGNVQVTNPYAAYSGNPDIQAAQINLGYNKLGYTPAYQGLMGGDYEALQAALTSPGAAAARTAYEQGLTNLQDIMGGKGLYGSSIMQNQQREALDKVYQQALADNAAKAAVERYRMEATDLQNKNSFGLNVYGQQMGENTAANQQALAIAQANQGDIQARNNLAYQAWQQRVAENLAGNQMGLEAQQSNQTNQQNLNALLNSVYNQQMAENQAANQQAYNTWATRLAENQAGQQMGLQAALANQSTYANLQGLLSQQGLARNAAALDYAKLLTGVNQQNAAQNLAAQQSNQAAQTALNQLLSQQGIAKNQAGLEYANLLTNVNQQNVANTLAQNQNLNALRSSDLQQLQGLLANQNIAQNQAGLDYAKLLTGVNQQNVANALAQSNQANALGLNYAQLATQTAADNATRALQQQQNLNALLSGDYQNLQGLLAGQNTAANAYVQAARAQDIARENQRNQYALQKFQLDEQQNKDLFTTALAANEDLNTYNTNRLNWDYANAENMRKWANQQPYEKYLYDQAAGAYQNQNDETLFNRALALAGLGNQSGTAASNYQLALQQLAAQQQAAANANSTANTASYLGALGLLGGGLLSNSKLFS